MKRILQLIAATIMIVVAASVCMASDIPPLNGHRVNDLAQKLSDKEHTQLAAQLKAIEDKTTAQVAILTVPKLPAGESIDTYRNKVFKEWKLGQKDKRNGVLIVYAANADDGKDHYGIEVGYGLEPIIPDAAVGDIIRHQLRAHADPKKGKTDFNGAFTSAVQVIGDKIAANVDPQTGTPITKSTDDFLVILTIGVVVVILVIFLLVAIGSSSGGQTTDRRSRYPSGGTSGRSSRQSRDDDNSFAAGALLGAAAGSGSGSSSGSQSGWADSDSGGGFSDGGFSGGGGDSGGGGASD